MPCRYRTDAARRCFAGKSVCRECLFVVIQLQILCAQLKLIACIFDSKFCCRKITVYNRLGCCIDKFTVLTVFQPKLTIVYEDENLLLVDKRPGVLSHSRDLQVDVSPISDMVSYFVFPFLILPVLALF